MQDEVLELMNSWKPLLLIYYNLKELTMIKNYFDFIISLNSM